MKQFAVMAPFLVCLGCAPQLGARSTEYERAEGDRISVEVSPMTNPLSTMVVVGKDGAVKAVQYSRYQLVVTSVWDGQAPKDVQTRLIRRLNNPVFADACNGQNFGGDGLTRGDQFQLVLEGRTKRQCRGFIEDAPPSVRQIIEDLLVLPQRIPRAALAEAYVRSETLTPERLASIRRAGQMRIINLAEAARDLQPTLENSIRRPNEFVPISHQEQGALRTLIAPAHDFVLASGDLGYQLTLFQVQ